MGTAGHCTVSVSKSIGRFDDTLFYLISFILLIRYWFKTPCMGIWVSWIDILNVRYLALWPLRRFALKLFVNSCERDSDRPRHPLPLASLLTSSFPPSVLTVTFGCNSYSYWDTSPAPGSWILLISVRQHLGRGQETPGAGDLQPTRSRDTWMWWRLLPRRSWQWDKGGNINN